MRLSQLAIYPIKSCAQITLTQAELSPFGLHNDRRWMLVDEQGVMLTQRKHARMCLIHCQTDHQLIRVNAPGMDELAIDTESTLHDNRSVPARVWEDDCRALDAGEQAAAWFTGFLGTPARLVYFPDDTFRQCDLNYAREGEQTAFSDGFPYLLISQASLDDLNSRLDQPVEMRRFRPNLVIEGSDAFAEDNWKRIRIGDINFRLVKPCSRCIIPSIDPDTGLKNAEPVKTLASYRQRQNKIYFGQNVVAEGHGVLETGMTVEVLE